jgi:type II secretory pathway component GspD/PulD (secretin)
LPVVTRRITNNTVTVKDGGTVAIAGLTENRKQTAESKVPGLSALPIVGKALFTNNDDNKSSREIAVFVTARLVPEMSAFNPSYAEPGAERESASQPLMMEPSGAEDFKSQLQDSLSRRGGSR